MAAAIERQLNKLLVEPLPTVDSPEARATGGACSRPIARGVIEHLARQTRTRSVIQITDAPGGKNESQYEGRVVIQGTGHLMAIEGRVTSTFPYALTGAGRTATTGGGTTTSAT